MGPIHQHGTQKPCRTRWDGYCRASDVDVGVACGSQRAMNPPSTGSATPVTHVDSSEAR